MKSCIDIDGMSRQMPSGWASLPQAEAESVRSSDDGTDESSFTSLPAFWNDAWPSLLSLHE
jgi:hypothetical protein